MNSDSDEITGTEDFLTEDQIKRRVWYIESWDCGDDLPDCGDDDCPRHGSTADELRDLRELQTEVDSGSYATLISENYFPAYVQNEREERGDGDSIPADLAQYIDWKSYAEDQESEYSSVTFRGTTYYTQ